MKILCSNFFVVSSTFYDLNMSASQYKASKAPTINHFYEKLLLLKDKMNTASGKKIAQERHEFMEKFLEQFYQEWGGEK